VAGSSTLNPANEKLSRLFQKNLIQPFHQIPLLLVKNLLLTFLLVGLFNPILAQTKGTPSNKEFTNGSRQKGQWFLGLNATGGLGRGSVSDSDLWSTTGQVGCFVANRWVTGLQVSYGAYHTMNKLAGTASYIPQPAGKSNERYFSPEIFSRYYFTSGKVKPFAQLSGGWNFRTREATYFVGEDTQVSASHFTANAALGVSFKLGKRASIDLMYNRSIVDKPQFGDFNGLRLGLTFRIGK
jgi:hypothetical protein